jgi:hypothetical protein
MSDLTVSDLKEFLANLKKIDSDIAGFMQEVTRGLEQFSGNEELRTMLAEAGNVLKGSRARVARSGALGLLLGGVFDMSSSYGIETI